MSGKETVNNYGSNGGQRDSSGSNKEGKKYVCSCGRYKGIVYTVLAGICVVLWSSLAKYTKEFNAFELSFYTCALSGSFILPIVVHKQRTWPTVTRRMVFYWVLFSVTLTMAVIFRIWAFKLLPLGDASSIAFSTPVFTALFARIILKDRITSMTIISLVLSIVAMLLTMKIPELIITGEFTSRLTSEDHLIGCIYALAAVITLAGAYLVMRSLRDVPVYFNSFVQICFGLFINGLMTPAFGGFHQPSCSLVTSVCVLAMSISGFLILIFTNQALKTEDPTTMGTVLRTTDVFLAFMVQVVIFHDGLNLYNISGAVVVLVSGLLMPLQRWMEGKPQGSAWKESWLIK